ncbi:MAG: NTP transferase domain-containing protein [Candidatus Kaiserbacteria bacterium]|nr:MAG: NTP transferase domain-containing protein [Candidatus Kaiserbacteria bacterium]
MQAVILAAGHGSRMGELTTAIPKPMIDVGGKPLLQYKLELLSDEFPEIEEVVVIVAYAKSVIQHTFGSKFSRLPIRYVEQREHNGTAGALWEAKELLKDRFLVMMGDDIYAKEDIAQALAVEQGWAVVVQQLPEMHRAGSVELSDDGLVARIVEGDLGAQPGIASTNLYLFDARLFTAPLVPKQAGSTEYGLPQTAAEGAKTLGIPLQPLFTDRWIEINAPQDLVRAATILKVRATTAVQ